MKRKLLNFKKLLILVPFVFGIFVLASCASSDVINVTFTTDNNVIKAGEFDLSDYKIRVDYKDGRSEEIVVDESIYETLIQRIEGELHA